MSSWYEQAETRLKNEFKTVTGRYELAMSYAVRDALLEFCRQNEEFAQAVAQGGSFKDCMTAVAKGVVGSISDLEAYSKALSEYSELLSPYMGQKISAIPREICKKAAELEQVMQKAAKEQRHYWRAADRCCERTLG